MTDVSAKIRVFSVAAAIAIGAVSIPVQSVAFAPFPGSTPGPSTPTPPSSPGPTASTPAPAPTPAAPTPSRSSRSVEGEPGEYYASPDRDRRKRLRSVISDRNGDPFRGVASDDICQGGKFASCD